MADINPIDNFVVCGGLPKIDPLPHIPGAESSGIAERVIIVAIIFYNNNSYEFLTYDMLNVSVEDSENEIIAGG